MGIPKFFKWLTERYPLIIHPIEPNYYPQFDNLYLDMNGIIHNCSHPEWIEDITKPLTEDQITIAIFHYIEKLFHTIKPRKLFYMAIDGVAPRAKMNQQRQRRFKSAAEAKLELVKAQKEGKKLDAGTSPFDSNCITPGTAFMEQLSIKLEYFIRKKINEDKSWRDVKVILSGHETPGEGEHKIMEYIRVEKMKKDHNPNESHCLYGLDADLIMLSLASHEPNFALLREEVVFGKKKKPSRDDPPPRFFLLYINLLREYLDQEFRLRRDTSLLPFPFSVENIIDDFILMCFFVGNDFFTSLALF